MKLYQNLINIFLRYHVVENIHTDEGRREVENWLRKIVKLARADAKKEERRNILLEKLCERRVKGVKDLRNNRR